jgi:amino acid transporter
MAWILAIYPWFFIATWNALAMEATASYIGETKNPSKDAPKAMTAAAITGLIIYTSIPFAMLGVSGSAAVAADPWGGFIGIASLYAGPYAKDIIGVMLYAALLLSTTNALIGCSRSLYQSSIEGLTIRWFGKLNKHGSPYRSMAFGVAFNLALVMVVAGLPTLIYVVSNVGYLFSFIPTGIAYYRLKRGYKGMPTRDRPYSLPGWFKGVAIACVVFFAIIWSTAGPLSPYSVYAIGGTALPPIFFWVLGLIILLIGIPMYYIGNKSYKQRMEAGTLSQSEAAQREHLQ